MFQLDELNPRVLTIVYHMPGNQSIIRTHDVPPHFSFTIDVQKYIDRAAYNEAIRVTTYYRYYEEESCAYVVMMNTH